MTTPGNRLKRVRENSGYKTAKDAAKAMGVPAATYTHHEAAERHLPGRRAAEYAAFYGVTPEYLLYGKGEEPLERVPIISPDGEDTGRTVAFPPPPTTLTLAQEALAGDGIAWPGYVALYNQPQTDFVVVVEDRLYVVCLKNLFPQNGPRRVIRFVQYGTKPDTYHLISPVGGLPMIDQDVEWLAPVTAFVPATPSVLT